jgi:hypothetical protein
MTFQASETQPRKKAEHWFFHYIPLQLEAISELGK